MINLRDPTSQLSSFEIQHQQEPQQFFKQYRLQFLQSNGDIDSVQQLPLKKCEEEDQVLPCEISSFVHPHFDKINPISPINKSGNSNISERIIQSDINPIKHLGPFSGSDPMNELPSQGSRLMPNLKYNPANNEMELDYSSFHPTTSNNHNTVSQNLNALSKSKQELSDIRIDRLVPQSQGRSISNIHGISDDSPKDLHHQGKDKTDLDELFDYNFTNGDEISANPQPVVEPKERLTISQFVQKQFKKVFTFEKIESANINHTVEIAESQYKLINDLASDVKFETEQQNSPFFKIVKKLCCCSRFPSLNPSSAFSIIWDMATIGFYGVFFIVLTIQIFMNASIFRDYSAISFNWMRTVTLIVFILDIVKNITTGFYTKGYYEPEILKIIFNYTKSRIWCDIIPLIPLFGKFEEISSFPVRVVCSLLYCFKYCNFHLCLERIRLSWIITRRNSIFKKYLQLLVSFILSVHLLAICYHGVSLIEIESGIDGDKSWLRRFNLSNDSQNVWERYLHSISACALYLSGQNIYPPQSHLEQGFALISSFLSLLVFANLFLSRKETIDLECIFLTILKLFAVFYELRLQFEENSLLEEEKKGINEYMKKMHIPLLLQGRVANYLEYLDKNKMVVNNLSNASNIIKKLPSDLRADLIYQTKNFYVPFFASVLKPFSQETIQNTFKIIEECTYSPGEMIFTEGDLEDPALFVVVQGKVEIFHSNPLKAGNEKSTSGNGLAPSQLSIFSAAASEKNSTSRLYRGRLTHLALLKSRQSLGEVSFFTNRPHSASARCTEFSTIVKITRQRFVNLLHETNQEEDFEMLCMLRDEVLFKQNYRAIGMRCQSCQKYGHLAKTCKLIHFYPLKSRIIQVALQMGFFARTQNHKQQRQPYIDRKKRIHYVQFIKNLEKQAKFVQDNSEEIDSYIEKYFPGQTNGSDYNQSSSQSASNTRQQSTNTEILTDKDYEKNQANNQEPQQPLQNSIFKTSNSTLNESSIIRPAPSGSRQWHKDSSDSGELGLKIHKDSDILLKARKESDFGKNRKDSALTKASSDSAGKYVSSNRSTNTALEIIKQESQEPQSKRKISDLSQPTDTLRREITLKSNKTRGTQKTNKTNKSSSSIYRGKFDYSLQHMDSRNTHSSIQVSTPLKSSPQDKQQEKGLNSDYQQIEAPNSKLSINQSGSKQPLKSSIISESFDSDNNQSYEVVLPRIELVMGAVNAQMLAQQQPLPIDVPLEHQNFSSFNLDQYSDQYSKSGSRLFGQGISSHYLDSYSKPYGSNNNNSMLEFDCMKNFKVYNTQSNPFIILANSPNSPLRLPRKYQKKLTNLQPS